MGQLSGKVAAITGAGSGIGQATAKILAARGASVLVTDVRAESAEETVRQITQAGGTAKAMVVDVEREEQIEAMIKAAVDHYGGLDVLHNNAVLIDQTQLSLDVSVLTIPTYWWDRTMVVNVRSVMLGCKYAVPEMLKRGGGSIINTASTLGISAEYGQLAYGTSKAAVIQLTKYVATAFGKQGIRCNAVAPALIATPVVDRVVPKEVRQKHADQCLTPDIGVPDDVGYAVAFLASDEARFITGHCLPVDGGTLAHLPTADLTRELDAWSAPSDLSPHMPARGR